MQFVINQSNYADSYREDREWGEWYVFNSITFEDAQIVKDSEYADAVLFPGENEPKVGDFIHVVAVTYDTGDSFGLETGCKCILWAFTNVNRAHELAGLVRKDALDNPDTFTVLNFDGVRIENYAWKGYFENFQGVEVYALRVVR